MQKLNSLRFFLIFSGAKGIENNKVSVQCKNLICMKNVDFDKNSNLGEIRRVAI